jgi:hypothetical protein
MNKDYNDLTNLFFNIFSISKKIMLLEKYDKNIEEIKFEEFYSLLNDFYLIIKKFKNNYILIQAFIDKYYNQIKFVKNFLLQIKNIKSRSLHDKIFINIFKMNSSHLPLGITFIFEEFIKGITFFNDEVEHIKKIPIYHRAASCGDSSPDFINKYLQCYSTNSNQVIENKKKHISKCYLERLIYNDMFKKLTLHFPSSLNNTEISQNIGHKFQLSERSHNYNKCFIGIDININILYERDFPTILTIKYTKDNNIIKKEEYVKGTYIDDYGNTRYFDNVFLTRYENGKTECILQKFEV